MGEVLERKVCALPHRMRALDASCVCGCLVKRSRFERTSERRGLDDARASDDLVHRSAILAPYADLQAFRPTRGQGRDFWNKRAVVQLGHIVAKRSVARDVAVRNFLQP